jgi:hypothetical protein
MNPGAAAAAAIGTSLIGGTVATLGTAKQRKQAKRAQKLLDTKYRDTSSTQGAAQGFRREQEYQRTADTRKFQDEMERLKASGVNPTLLNQRRKFHMDAMAEQKAVAGAQAEMLARQQLAGKRAELTAKANVPTAGERFMQGMGVAAPIASTVGEAVSDYQPAGKSTDTPEMIDDHAKQFGDK